MSSIFNPVSKRIEFQNRIQGTYGEFATPAGRVNYLLTKARLGEDSTDQERRLTRHLVPVREVIPPEQLDFSQLLQRDLDDHRVAIGLIPYLLKPAMNGPAYFPPIVAVLLPFKSKAPSKFPEVNGPDFVTDDLPWHEWSAGESVRLRRLADEKGGVNPISLGEVAWNGESCQLVVVDGQHRAMALLAIDRTIRKAWQEGAGAKYKYFYENRVTSLLQETGSTLENIEVPVTVLWFPDMFGEDRDPHAAARKLFVDVNKEARTPSESRLILLSDTELQNIFVRSVLKKLRNTQDRSRIPLYCVEYDNPDIKNTQSARWSALTNIHSIKQMVSRAVFGPGKYVNRVNVAIAKREPLGERDAFMREQLNVASVFPATIGTDFARDDLGNDTFPAEAIELLAEAFDESWGTAIIEVLSGIVFYNAHATALNQIKDAWLSDDAISTLAFDALFGGIGMYWTLRESSEHWKRLKEGDPRAPKPDVVKAWELLLKKQNEFERQRSTVLFASASRVSETNAVFQAANTQACQVGLILTFATVCRQALRPSSPGIRDISVALTRAINTWIAAKNSGAYDRRLFLLRPGDGAPKYPLNLITHMDTPRSIQFRYFWLEILNSPEARSDIDAVVDLESLARLRDEARTNYVDFIAALKTKALKTSHPELTEAQRVSRGMSGARSEVRKALGKWFVWEDESELNEWFTDLQSEPQSEATSESDLNQDESPDHEELLEDALEDLQESED